MLDFHFRKSDRCSHCKYHEEYWHFDRQAKGHRGSIARRDRWSKTPQGILVDIASGHLDSFLSAFSVL